MLSINVNITTEQLIQEIANVCFWESGFPSDEDFDPFEFIVKLEEEIQDADLCLNLAKHFLQQCIRTEVIENREELRSLFKEMENEFPINE